jgi:hypothetical protein
MLLRMFAVYHGYNCFKLIPESSEVHLSIIKQIQILMEVVAPISADNSSQDNESQNSSTGQA